jgi:hypothetical protein
MFSPHRTLQASIPEPLVCVRLLEQGQFLIWLQVLLLLLQTGSPGLGTEPDPASAFVDLPMLRAVVESDVAGRG